jgi:predicted Zn-dependent peptidase
MLVASGVEFSNFETALEEILTQLENVRNGDISDWELISAKRSIITSVKSALDRHGGLEELYFDSAIAAVHYDPVQLSEMVEAVTLERVISAASGIKPDSVYFLTGNDENK